MRNEFRLIERLKRLIPRSLQGPFAIGDDAAILPVGPRKCLLLTTDVIVEGVDFRIGRGGAQPEQIGHKALAVNLSDIAAMGGTPLAFVVSWGIPKRFSGKWVERIAKGILPLARTFDTAWVGGDISRATRLFISVALLGEGKRGEVVERKGARSGDLIYVTGKLGGSIYGKHLSFCPRVEEARYLVKAFHPTAMIDISDGFIQDLEHLLAASRVGAKVDLERIPVSKAALAKRGQSPFKGTVPFKRDRLARGAWRKALKSALTDGEDFELLFTLPFKEGRRLEKAWPQRFGRLRLTRAGEILSVPLGKIEWYDSGRKLKGLWFRKKGFTHF